MKPAQARPRTAIPHPSAASAPVPPLWIQGLENNDNPFALSAPLVLEIRSWCPGWRGRTLRGGVRECTVNWSGTVAKVSKQPGSDRSPEGRIVRPATPDASASQLATPHGHVAACPGSCGYPGALRSMRSSLSSARVTEARASSIAFVSAYEIGPYGSSGTTLETLRHRLLTSASSRRS